MGSSLLLLSLPRGTRGEGGRPKAGRVGVAQQGDILVERERACASKAAHSAGGESVGEAA